VPEASPSTPTSAPAEPFFELSLDPLITAGFDGYVKRINEAGLRTLGWSEDELRAVPYTDFIHPEDRERTLQEAARLAVPGTETRDFEIRLRTRERGYRVFLFSARGALDEGVIYTVAKDITERKAAEAALEAANAQLERHAADLRRSNEHLERFAYVASHDLSEPLRMVTGFVGLLRRRYEGQLDGEADEFIGYIVDGVERMQALIRDLLTYSRVGRAELQVAPVVMGEVVTRATETLAPAIEEAGAVIEVGTLPTLEGDPSQLNQLMQNLLGNAVKFAGEEPPEVRIDTERQEGGWRFAVADNGIGIDSRYRERIFELFQRLHSPEEYPGTGIGLAICRTIVERHGGSIWMEPRDGRGSTFVFTIPDRGGQG
jgi:PAS domain S-box-containing protein